ncbi:hypothetical protein [Streptomyces sp. NPDC002845]
MGNPEMRWDVRRAHSRIRDDEELVLLLGFDQMFQPVGAGLGHRLPGGVAALTRFRILLVQSEQYTSLPHPIVKQSTVRPKLLLPSTLVIDAGPMWGTLMLVGARRALKDLGKGINQFAGRQIPEQPVTRLVPTLGLGRPRCAACGVDEQWYGMTLEYCHGCLRSFEWTDRRRELMGKYREFVKTRRSEGLPPQDLMTWIVEETRK